jgi:hypothetical protein
MPRPIGPIGTGSPLPRVGRADGGARNRADMVRRDSLIQVSYSERFNCPDRRKGHVFQGRFKFDQVLDESALDPVGRYVHLNPVRIFGLGLSKKDQQRARGIGCPNPGRELVSRRVAALREYRKCSWWIYAGLESAVPWLCRGRLQAGCGGRSLKEQRRALREYTEARIRKGTLESPWVRLVGSLILVGPAEAEWIFERIRSNRTEPPRLHGWPGPFDRNGSISWPEGVGDDGSAGKQGWK